MLSTALRPVRFTQNLFVATGILLIAATVYPQTIDSRTADIAKAQAKAQCAQTERLSNAPKQ